jgi:AcrR family transcriptional regulator
MFSEMATRPYELRERARRQEETRQRIVDATEALHREVGPAKTTVAEVARRAGVTRVTVYNHFPDDLALFGACSASFIAHHPPPDPRAWAAVADPAERLRTALRERYAWFRENEAMVGNVARDAALLPALAEVLRSPPAMALETAMRDVLLAGRGLRGARRERARAAIGLAVAFPTWQRLVRVEGLGDAQAVALMAGAVEAV